MIQKCHAAGKPVTVVSQVLESMVRGMVPTSSEVNDIANLVEKSLKLLLKAIRSWMVLMAWHSLLRLPMDCIEKSQSKRSQDFASNF